MQNILERMMRETASSREYSNEILIRYFNIFLFYLRKQLADSSVEHHSKPEYSIVPAI